MSESVPMPVALRSYELSRGEPNASRDPQEAGETRTGVALLVCAHTEHLRVLADSLRECGLLPVLASTLQDAKAILSQKAIRLVFWEEVAPGGGFRELLNAAPGPARRIPIVVMSSAGDWNHYLLAMRNGAFDCISWPPRRAEVNWAVQCASRTSLRERVPRRG